MTPRLVRHGDLLSVPLPVAWRCVICRGPDEPGQDTPCERCGGVMHWRCYWPATLTATERAGLTAALAADPHPPTTPVELVVAGRRLRFDTPTPPSASAAFLDGLLALCPGCRS